jgi:hypothetical protein
MRCGSGGTSSDVIGLGYLEQLFSPDGTQHSVVCGLDRSNVHAMVHREDGKAAIRRVA